MTTSRRDDARRELARRELARRELAGWCEYGPSTELGPVVLEAWQRDMAARQERLYRWAAERGSDARAVYVLLLSAPPQVGKSLVTSQRGPGWAAAELGLSVAICSYASALARKQAMRNRAALASHAAMQVWPHLAERSGDDVWTQEDYSVPARDGRSSAHIMAVGRDGALTGHMVDAIVLDDLYKSESDYLSAASRREVDDFLRTQAISRLMERGGGLIDMGTRWGVRDTRGWWEDRIAEMRAAGLAVTVDSASYPLRGPESWRHGERGYLSARWDPKKETAARILYGDMAAAILDCAPVDSVGGLYEGGSLDHTYDLHPAAAASECSATYLSMDAAETEGRNDHTVIQWWGVRADHALLLRQWREQYSTDGVVRMVADAIAETKPAGVLIEDASAGKVALWALQQAGRVRGLAAPIVPVRVAGQGTKRDRIRGTRLLWASSRVQIPRPGPGAEWCYARDRDGRDWRGRMYALRGERPDMRGEVDDEADAATIFLRWWLDETAHSAGDLDDLYDDLGV